MSRFLNYIKLLNEISSRLTKVVDDFWLITKLTKDKHIKADLCKFVSRYSSLNYEFICYLIDKTYIACDEEKTEKLFKDIMNENFKKKGEK